MTVSDPDAGQTVTMTVSTAAINGTATVDDSGAFTYTPTGTFTGIDTFAVRGCDDGTPSLCDTGVVTVTEAAPSPALTRHRRRTGSRSTSTSRPTTSATQGPPPW